MGDMVIGCGDGGDSRPRFACAANDAAADDSDDDESLAAKRKKEKTRNINSNPLCGGAMRLTSSATERLERLQENNSRKATKAYESFCELY